jgi:hypothetical protein
LEGFMQPQDVFLAVGEPPFLQTGLGNVRSVGDGSTRLARGVGMHRSKKALEEAFP